MKILGIESSCDETAAAVLECENGKFTVLSDKVASQIEMHTRYGGVVPEIASRAHCEILSKITYDALSEAGVKIADIDAVAVTAYPGLIGALLVGVNFAKGLAYSSGKPLVAVDHIKGHIAANYVSENRPEPPYIAFVASGGHTSIVRVNGYDSHTVIGGTRDDAMGEAFDKVARVMGMPYPGGAAMDKLVYEGKAILPFPSAAIRDDSLDFSFSGIKTAVLNYINSTAQKGGELNRADVAASFCRAAVSSVSAKLSLAIDRNPDIKAVALAGGVAANSHLRAEMEKLCKSKGLPLYYPEKKYCGDNAVMIAVAGYFEYIKGNIAPLSLNAEAARFEDV